MPIASQLLSLLSVFSVIPSITFGQDYASTGNVEVANYLEGRFISYHLPSYFEAASKNPNGPIDFNMCGAAASLELVGVYEKLFPESLYAVDVVNAIEFIAKLKAALIAYDVDELVISQIFARFSTIDAEESTELAFDGSEVFADDGYLQSILFTEFARFQEAIPSLGIRSCERHIYRPDIKTNPDGAMVYWSTELRQDVCGQLDNFPNCIWSNINKLYAEGGDFIFRAEWNDGAVAEKTWSFVKLTYTYTEFGENMELLGEFPVVVLDRD